MNYTWNKVYNFVMKLKAEYIEAHPEDRDVYDYHGYNSVIHKWADGQKWAQNIVNFLMINQYGDLCLLKYKSYNAIFGQVEYDEFWDMCDQFFRYCRGVTIDVRNDELVLCAFDKFFNLDELPETSISEVEKRIKNAKHEPEITDKMDGSLQMARCYNGEIILSGSTSLDPDQSYRVANGISFLSAHPNYVNMLENNPDICFIFESIMPDDPHVVFYDYEKAKGLYLIGARNVYTGHVLNYDELAEYIQEYTPLSTVQEPITFEEMMDQRKNYKCDKKEGWVVNIDGWRVKVKCDDFLLFHSLLSGVRKNSDRLGGAILEALKNDRLDDFISTIPAGKYRSDALATLKIINDYVAYFEESTKNYYEDGLAVVDTPKEFMAWVDKNVPKQFQGFVRNKYRGKSSDYLKGKKFKDVLEVMSNAET